MYRITNINTGKIIGAVDNVMYIKIGESGDFTPPLRTKPSESP